jgi:hypothetical protein
LGQDHRGLARLMLHGVKKLGFKFTLTISGYNLTHLPELLAARAATNPSLRSGAEARVDFEKEIQNLQPRKVQRSAIE